jgi:MerR family transcriptional regulator, light-induced transcriptional regulator
MTKKNAPTPAGTQTFRSGVAARLAGIPVETLRVWERRYRVVGPRLSARGQRQYTPAEVRRLGLIKQLLDQGHPIGKLAKLTTPALIAMQSTVRSLAAEVGGSGVISARVIRAAVVGPQLTSNFFLDALSQAMAGHEPTIVARASSLNGAENALRGSSVDIVIMEVPTPLDDSPAKVAAVKKICGAEHSIVLYRFAPSNIVRKLRDAGNTVARAPSTQPELAALCQRLLLPRTTANDATTNVHDVHPAPPRFDEHALAAFAGASSTVYCECPRHLVDLLRDIVSFERYSAACASRSPDDAELHRDLQFTAGQARMLLEKALLRVAIAEGIPVPAAPER